MKRMVVSIILLFMLLSSVQPAMALERRINTWLVCGTFSCKDNAAFEQDPFDAASVAPRIDTASDGKPWLLCDDRLYCRNLDDYVDLYTFFNAVRSGSPGEPTDMRAAYAHVYVWSPIEQPVQIAIGSNDGCRVWLNGQLLHSEYSLMRTLERDSSHISGKLNTGWNRLLLKVQNGKGVWGFYAALETEDGKPVDGLEYATEPPDGELRITTNALPTAYAGLPYVWLEINGAKPENRVPSASPFRFMATGGTPPYQWKAASATPLPSGLYMDGVEGELLGVSGYATGEIPFRILVQDATGASACHDFMLKVNTRVTKWMEEGKLGGLIHGVKGYGYPHGDPVQQAEMLAQEGYAFAYPTTGWFILPENWPGNMDADKLKNSADVAEKLGGKLSNHQDMSAYVKAFHEQGVRFGSYVGLFDNISLAFEKEKDFTLWPAYLDALHAHFQALCVEYQPAALYLDGAHHLHEDKYDWNFDAMYSLIKTLAPACIVMPNLASYPDIGYCVGDADVVSVEGSNDSDPYWTRWPENQCARNPKYMPVATWRYPFTWAMWDGTERAANRKPGEPDYQDPQEWLRVLVSLIGEGYICDLDHSFGFGREEMHVKIGEWLHPRLDAIKGTKPVPTLSGDWGYAVAKGDTLYLHILKNPRGKIGLNGRKSIELHSISQAVASVSVFPSNTPIAFKQDGERLALQLAGLESDPVSTIIKILFAPGNAPTASMP